MTIRNIWRISAFFIACVLSFQSLGAILYTNANETPLKNGGSSIDSGYMNRLTDSCVRPDPTQPYIHSDAQHIRRVASPRRAGAYGMVMLLQKGCDYRPANEGGTLQKPRVGFSPSKSIVMSNAADSVKRERWITFSFYLPEDFTFESNSANVDTLFQYFKEGSRSIEANNFNVRIVQNDLRIVYNNTGSTGAEGGEYVAVADLVKNQWYDVTVHIKLQEPGGSGGFFRWYINYPGYATPQTPVFTNTDLGASTVNTQTGAGDHSIQLNIYKHTGYCTSTYQADPVACPYNAATGYPKATNSATNWTGQRKIYFDELRVGDYTSSLAEVAPHIGTYVPEDPAITQVNLGSPITTNLDHIYFTAANGAVNGCLQVNIKDSIGVSQTAAKCKSNATGGRFTAGDLSTLSAGPGTFELVYDVPLFDSDTMTAAPSTWTAINSGTVATFTNGTSDLDYGFTRGTLITSTGQQTYIYPPTADRVTIADGATGAARFVYSTNTDTQVRLLITNGVGDIEYSGTPGSLNLAQSETGTGHAITEWYNNGFLFADITFIANNSVSPTSYRPQIGPKNITAGKAIVAWDMKLWANRTPKTLTYPTTISKVDIDPPGLFDCQIVKQNLSEAMSLGCGRDDSTGTFYSVISTSTTAPSLAQVKAGQDHTGAAALWAGSQVATSGSFTTGALNPYVQKCAYFAQTDAAANDSVVVAGEACIPAEPTVTKKFVWSTAVGNAISCYNAVNNTFAPYTGNMAVTITSGDFFTPGDNETELAYAPVVAFVAGQAEMDEADVTTGSINALSAGAQGYNYWATNGTCRADNAIQLTVE